MRTYTFTFLLALLVCVPSYAADSFHFGVAPSVAMVSVKDPDGSTKSTTTGELLNFFMTQNFGRDNRLMYQGYYHAFNLDAGTGDIGQHVTRTGVSFTWETEFRVARGWKPWGGAGLGISQEKYKNRHTVDSGGFLLAEFPARDTTNYSLVLGAGTQWNLSSNWDAGIRVQYEQPFSNGTSAASLAFMLLF